MIVPLNIPPGVTNNGTDYDNRNRWVDSYLIRWVEGHPQTMDEISILGSGSYYTGVPRSLIGWRDYSDNAWMVIGTNESVASARVLWVQKPDLTAYDISPAGFTTGNVNGSVANSVITPPDTWTMDLWGQYLVCCNTSDGKIYEWQLDTGTVAQVVANAPTGNKAIVVTPEGFIFALGAGGDDKRVEWCDQRDNTTWTATAANQAGGYNLEAEGRLVGGSAAGGEILLWTDREVFRAQYIGQPFIYGFDRIGATSLAGPNAMAALDFGAVWMGTDAFYMYDGAIRELQCSVRDHVFDNLDKTNAAKVFAFTQRDYSEVWWLYPGGSTENDRYVVWNYKDNLWYSTSNTFGSTGGYSWTVGMDRGVLSVPVLYRSTGNHNVMTTTGGFQGYFPFIKSGVLDFGQESRDVHVLSIWPDHATKNGSDIASLRLYLYGQQQLLDAESTLGASPYVASPAPVNVRVRAKHLKVKYEATDSHIIGIQRFQVMFGGRRE